jgi:hypothetical protein
MKTGIAATRPEKKWMIPFLQSLPYAREQPIVYLLGVLSITG